MKGGLSSVALNKITHSMLQLEPMNLTIKHLLSFFFFWESHYQFTSLTWQQELENEKLDEKAKK
jgi:hypothetical protein